MARPRKSNLNLPPNVHFKHGAFYFVQAGKSERLADTLPPALAAYGRRIQMQAVPGIPNTLPRLIDKFVAEWCRKARYCARHRRPGEPDQRRSPGLSGSRLWKRALLLASSDGWADGRPNARAYRYSVVFIARAADARYFVRTSATSPNQYAAVTPPSMRKSLPVMNPPSAPISSAATAATSSGVPGRPAADPSIMRR